MASAKANAAKRSVLIINPNSTEAMTEGLKTLISDHQIQERLDLSINYFTAPSGPPSINNEDDGAESTKHCLPLLTPAMLQAHDGFVVACYSVHDLVGWLRARPEVTANKKPVFGIFEASILKSLQVIGAEERYGIISTGKYWEKALADGIEQVAVEQARVQFAGVETTGLTAKELHDVPEEQVQAKLTTATRRLVRSGNVTAVCLGCAGMAGMDETVREACILELGVEKGKQVKIIDGVVAAVELISAALR